MQKRIIDRATGGADQLGEISQQNGIGMKIKISIHWENDKNNFQMAIRFFNLNKNLLGNLITILVI